MEVVPFVVDYGDDVMVSDSLQAIRKHDFVNVLQDPGSADLSAYVDFAAIKHVVEDAAGKFSLQKSLHCSSHLKGHTKFSG
jgi:NADH dehydrogenase [ubiquinone] 1 alpha subcomplex assembly factor 7